MVRFFCFNGELGGRDQDAVILSLNPQVQKLLIRCVLKLFGVLVSDYVRVDEAEQFVFKWIWLLNFRRIAYSEGNAKMFVLFRVALPAPIRLLVSMVAVV